MITNLSVIILSYNTKELTKQCLLKLIRNLPKNKHFTSEILIVDNGSTDGSVKEIKNLILNQNKYGSGLPRTDLRSGTGVKFKVIFNKKNVGYPKGNNQALKVASGKYVLFLNSDTLIEKINFEKLIAYCEKHPDIGVLTVKVMLSDQKIDSASHRGFPTIWNSFCYFIGLEKMFRSIPFFNRIFGGYHLVHLNLEKTHEIDSPSGAFYFSRRKVLKQLAGFDESFFMYGEDLDLSFRIKKLGYKIIYYPAFKVVHLKHLSGLEKNDNRVREITKYHFFQAMKIFYKKHYEKRHFFITNKIIYFLIDIVRNIHV